jgi:transcriptional regulator with XRE-family HTH domain
MRLPDSSADMYCSAMTDIDGPACRAGRALLGIDQQVLAERAGVGVSTLRNFESGVSRPRRAILAAIRNTLETAGIVFCRKDDGTLWVSRRAEPKSDV